MSENFYSALSFNETIFYPKFELFSDLTWADSLQTQDFNFSDNIENKTPKKAEITEENSVGKKELISEPIVFENRSKLQDGLERQLSCLVSEAHGAPTSLKSTDELSSDRSKTKKYKKKAKTLSELNQTQWIKTKASATKLKIKRERNKVHAKEYRNRFSDYIKDLEYFCIKSGLNLPEKPKKHSPNSEEIFKEVKSKFDNNDIHYKRERNRISAMLYRARKSQYIRELESTVANYNKK
jgi:hypothetical protein